jgi:hypothetical protein
VGGLGIIAAGKTQEAGQKKTSIQYPRPAHTTIVYSAPGAVAAELIQSGGEENPMAHRTVLTSPIWGCRRYFQIRLIMMEEHIVGIKYINLNIFLNGSFHTTSAAP